MYRLGKLVFLANRRVASNATVGALRSIGFTQGRTSHHGSYYRPDWTYFTTVRNHWDAIASWAGVQGEERPVSLDWLKRLVDQLDDGSPGRMWHWVGTKYNPDVLRYEGLPDCLFGYLAAQGLALTELKHTSSPRPKGQHYSTYFGKDARQFIYDRYRSEIEELGYTFEEK